MPPIKYYEVEQTRTVKVSANSAAQAALIANTAFAASTPSEDLIPKEELSGVILGRIEVTRLDVSKEM